MLVLMTVLVVVWRGYEFGDSNHAVQVPLQRAAADPTLYARDLLLRSAGGFATFFFKALSRLEGWVGHDEALYFFFYVVGHLVALSALVALTRLFFRGDAPVVAACLLYVSRPFSLGGDSTWFSLLTHAHVAAGLLLWAFWLHLSGRYVAALALTGAVANLHALYAVHVAALLGFDLLLRARELGVRRLVQAGLAFLLPALPTLSWLALSGAAGVAPERVAEWLAIMRERSPQHTFPLDARPSLYGGYGLFLALALVAGSLPARRELRASLQRLFVGVALLALLAVICSELVPIPAVIRAQPMRAIKWLTLLLLPILGRGLAAAWRWGGLSRAAAVIALFGLVLSRYGLLAPALLLLLLDASRRRFPLGRVAVGGVALVAAAASAAVGDLPRQFSLGEAGDLVRGTFEDPLLAGLVVLLILVRVALAQPRALWSRGVPAAAAALALALLPVVEQRGREERAARPWVQVQEWARAHTPRAALFLTPPYQEGFRVFSERAIVGEWKDGTQQFFSSEFGFEWRARMRDLRAPGRGYDGLTTAGLATLARRYGAEFIVAAAERPLDLPRVYSNAEWSVYSLAAAP